MTTTNVVATVILPTTGDRAPVLRHSIPAMLNQSVRELELFVIGDGLDDEARALVNDFARSDARVRLFDFPKHRRRGEVYRHEALQEANGSIVCYVCDRDLLLPNHVEIHAAMSQQFDLSFSMAIIIGTDGQPSFVRRPFFGALSGASSPSIAPSVVQLSATSHTRSAYLKLPFGWRTTPAGIPTDQYMWQQFIDQPWCRVGSTFESTLLYFKRGNHPGMPSIARGAELQQWVEVASDRSATSRLVDQATQAEVVEATRYGAAIRRTPILICGKTPRELWRILKARVVGG